MADQDKSREALRLNAVREAYWHGSLPDVTEFSVLRDVLQQMGVAESPTVGQQRDLFFLLPQQLIGLGIAKGFGDAEVARAVHSFAKDHAEDLAREFEK